jgi:hypothetical protein
VAQWEATPSRRRQTRLPVEAIEKTLEILIIERQRLHEQQAKPSRLRPIDGRSCIGNASLLKLGGLAACPLRASQPRNPLSVPPITHGPTRGLFYVHFRWRQPYRLSRCRSLADPRHAPSRRWPTELRDFIGTDTAPHGAGAEAESGQERARSNGRGRRHSLEARAAGDGPFSARVLCPESALRPGHQLTAVRAGLRRDALRLAHPAAADVDPTTPARARPLAVHNGLKHVF